MATVDLLLGILKSGGINPGNPIITYSNGAGCFATLTATVNPTPTAIIGNPTLCQSGTSVTLSDAIGGGTWSGGNTTVATIALVTGILRPMGSAGDSIITYTNGADTGLGCSAQITATVNITPQPITGNPTLCVAGIGTVALGETATDCAPGAAAIQQWRQ